MTKRKGTYSTLHTNWAHVVCPILNLFLFKECPIVVNAVSKKINPDAPINPTDLDISFVYVTYKYTQKNTYINRLQNPAFDDHVSAISSITLIFL